MQRNSNNSAESIDNEPNNDSLKMFCDRSFFHLENISIKRAYAGRERGSEKMYDCV